MTSNHNKKIISISVCLLCVLLTMSGCGKSSKRAGYEEIESIKHNIEEKYDEEGIEIVDYERGRIGSPVPFAGGEYDGTYKLTLQDENGKEFHGFAQTEEDGILHVYDDREYNKVLEDVIEEYKLPNECKITIAYGFKRFGVRNMLEELYAGDLSKVGQVKVRVDYIDANIKDIDYPDIEYVLVSYESEEALNGWYQEEWWSIPDQPPIGVKEIKTNDDYREIYNTSFGRYIVVSYEPFEISECEDFDEQKLVGNGMTSASKLSDPITISAKDHLKIAWRPEQEYTEDDVKNMRLGIRFFYDKQNDYCYGTRSVYVKDGYLVADCTKKEIDVVFLEP